MAKDFDSKSSPGFMRRLSKTKNGMTSGSEDASSEVVEGRKALKRVTRHNGSSSTEESKLPEKVSVSRKGTAAALMGGKRRAGTTSSNETVSTRRTALEKPAGDSSSLQRKVPKSKRAAEETVADSKTEGGSSKRRRMESSIEHVKSEVESNTIMQTGVQPSVVEEEEVVESSEVEICQDGSLLLNDEKKKQIEEFQQLLKPDTSGSTVAAQNLSSQKFLLQQCDEHMENETITQLPVNVQSEDRNVVVSGKMGTTKAVAEEVKNKNVECGGKPSKNRNFPAMLSGKTDTYFPSIDAGCEVFSDDDDIGNLLRIEQRCASVQSWVARQSHEEIEPEPNVEQMEVEEEVTVEGGGVLLVEDGSLLNSKTVSEKVSDDNEIRLQADKFTAAKFDLPAAVAADLGFVDEQKTDASELINPEVNVSAHVLETVTESPITDGENLMSDINNDEEEEGSAGNLKVDFGSSEECTTFKDLNGTEQLGGIVKDAPKKDIPLVITESIVSVAEKSDNNTDRKSSTNESLSGADLFPMPNLQDSGASVGTRLDTVSAVIETSDVETESSGVPEVMQLDEEEADTDNQLSTQHDSASTTVLQSKSSLPASAADEGSSSQAVGRTTYNSSEHLPETSPSEDEKLDQSGESTQVQSSSHGDDVELEDKLHSSDTQPQQRDASSDEVAETETASNKDTSVMTSAVSVQPGPVPVVVISTTSGGPAMSVVVARTFTSTVAGSGAPAATSVVAAGALPGFVGMPPVAIRAAVPGSAVGSVFVHVADPRQFAMHLQQQGQRGQTPMFHIPALSPQQGGGPPQLVMSPLSPQHLALLSSSTSQPPHPQLVGGVPPRHVTLVTSGPRPQLLQQCLLTSAGPQPLTLLSAPQSASTTSSSTSSTAVQSTVPVQHVAILSPTLQGTGGTTTSTTVPSSGQPVALIAAAGPNQAPVMRMAPAVIPRHQMSASSAMQHLTSAISLQQLQLSFAAAAAAAQQQQVPSSTVRSPIPIQRLPVICTTHPSMSSSAASQSSATMVSLAAPVVSLPVSPMVSVAASALTAFLKKENLASQLLSPPATTIAKLSPHDVALKGT